MTPALTFSEAAECLRVSRRWLAYWLKKYPTDAGGNPFYIPIGRRKTFESRDVERIRGYIAVSGDRPNKLAKIISPFEMAETWLANNRQESAVYFIAVREFIKIGWTKNWRKRISQMQTANPDRIEILLVVGRPVVYEKTMHQKFAEHRTRGEWFTDCPAIRDHIATIKSECWYQAGRIK